MRASGEKGSKPSGTIRALLPNRRCALSALIVLAVALVQATGILQPVQNALSEFRFGATERAASGEIVFVEIDPRSLQAVGQWPWPRSLHARAIERLVDAGAVEITFDIDFSAASTPSEDDTFERALAAADGLVALPTFRQVWSEAFDQHLEHINVPLAQFGRHTWATTVNVVPDRDGKVRKFAFGDTIDGEFRPSLAGLYGGLPTDARKSFNIDFAIDPGTVPRISYADVLNSDRPLSIVEGRKVLIGASAAELRDNFAVPRHGIMAGPMLQILGAESVLQGRALSQSSLLATLGGLVIIALISSALCRRRSWKIHLATLAALALALEAGAIAVQSAMPIILQTAAWHLAIAVLCARSILSEVDFRGLMIQVANTETRNARNLLDQVVGDNFDGIIVFDDRGLVLSANTSAAEILRLLDTADLEGRDMDAVLPLPVATHVRTILTGFANGDAPLREPIEAECELGPDNAVLEFVATPSLIADASRHHSKSTQRQTIVSLTFRDVTERNRAQTEIAYMAHFDTLTGLANRNQLNELLTRSLEDQRGTDSSLAVIYFDLDRFKNVNDTLGHHVGDLLLRQVAERAQALIGADGFIARFGADEFVAVLTQAGSIEAARAMAQTLVDRLRIPYDFNGHRVIVGASAGVTWCDDEMRNGEDLVRNADAALHKAKTLGGNIVGLFETGMDARLQSRRQLELDLWKAFDRGEFEIFFQPQIDMSDGRLNGAEALVRWKHPERGYVSPAEFIPAVEDIGLMSELGSWILNAACAEAAKWPAAQERSDTSANTLKVAINLSSHQFRTGDLVGTVEAALAKSGLDATRLDLEITESLLMDESPVTLAILTRIREMGIGLALDDFGTGYSSLSYIHRLPLTKIKIDQAFVRGLPNNKGSLAIVRAVTTLASSLELSTTVEGIETEDQMQILRLVGCDQGQGYLFGRPQPACDFLNTIAAQQPGQALVA